MITEDILVKYLAGETEPHEKAMIDKWRESSGENEKYFRQLETLWVGSAGLSKTKNVDVDAAWNKVRYRLKSPGRGRVFDLKTRWLVAASLILLIGLGLYFISISEYNTKMITLNVSNTSQNIRLSDGSKLLLKNAQLVYPNKFTGKKRRLKLNSGKVFFDVAKNMEKPFEIEANETVITVIGTKFEVASYADYTQVILKEGKVKFSTPGGEIFLSSGMAAKYMHKEHRLERMLIRSKNTFAYASGSLVFENDLLEQVVRDLNQYFDSEVILEHPGLADCVITSTFTNEKLENILAVIAGTLNLEVEHVPNSNRILLKGGSCRQ